VTASYALSRASLLIAAAMLLAGCGGIVSSGQFSQTAADVHTSPVASYSGQAASRGTLLYVSDTGDEAVTFYSYPKGIKLGQLSGLGLPLGLCVDGTGDIFVTNIAASGDSNVIEYAHGATTPLQTLEDPGMLPNGCAVNPVTGDLAVTNYCQLRMNQCTHDGNVAIYPKATGLPRYHGDFAVSSFEYCTYNPSGTLFADGFGGRGGRHSGFKLVRMVNGRDKFTPVPVHWTYSKPPIVDPGGVQWDDHLLAVAYSQGEDVTPSIYRVDPANGRIVSVLTMNGSQLVIQFFIHGNVLIAPNRQSEKGEILFYRYPKGTKMRKVIGGLSQPNAVVLSPGSS
jgi:hypothetical protein